MPYNKTVEKTTMTKTKTKRVTVTPLSRKAKNRFANEMDLFHSCTIENEREMADGSQWMFLKSLNQCYFFWVPVKGNKDWKVDK
ncbi:MAG: hypothetical protein CML44_03575 [Rhodobacteraceae bacterium]|nr:hypothetical protein [Paracoccaceae bacterium]